MGSKSIGMVLPIAGGSLLLLLVFFFLYSLLPSVCYIAVSQQKQPQQHITYTGQSYSEDPVGPPSEDDMKWAKAQLEKNHLGEGQGWHQLRKGINPRTREEQLQDLRKYKGISHYDDNNHTAMVCPGELLVEEHHSNYGEPWAGGRDVYEFLGKAIMLRREHQVLEVGCGTLRVALHFIRYLNRGKFHCIERDELSLMAALKYEIPSQGLLHKRPLIVRSEDMDLSRLTREGGEHMQYDLIYASAVFLHMPDALVWTGLERLAPRLSPIHGRLFVSHNIKFCTRLRGENECSKRLSKVGLEFVGKHTHDSLLFNHYEIWFEFRHINS